MDSKGQTVFEDIVTKWVAVEMKDGSLKIQCFVDAVNDFLVVFNALGSAFFTDMVKSDIKKNLEKIEAASQKYGAETLKGMVEAELDERVCSYSYSGTEGLLWLKRTLQFILLLLQYIVTKSSHIPLNECAAMAYEQTLKPCHNWLLQRLFDAGLLAVPSRDAFFGDLGTDEEAVRLGMQSFIEIAARHLNPIVAFYNQTQLDAQCITALNIPSENDSQATAVLC